MMFGRVNGSFLENTDNSYPFNNNTTIESEILPDNFNDRITLPARDV
jgi:hypothetical protein